MDRGSETQLQVCEKYSSPTKDQIYAKSALIYGIQLTNVDFCGQSLTVYHPWLVICSLPDCILATVVLYLSQSGLT